MAKRKFRMTVEVEIADWTADERKENAEMQGCKASELPRVRDIEACDFADMLTGVWEYSAEMWGGTEMYARIVKTKVVNNEFLS